MLTGAIDALGRCGVPAAADTLIAVRAQQDRLAAMLAESEVRFDTAALWRDDGAGSMRGWLADRGRLGRRAGADVARRIERLEHWPEISRAWLTGQLSGAQVELIVAAIPRRFRSLFADHAASMVEHLAPLDMADTETALRHWVRCAQNPDGPDQFHERPSGLHLDRTFDDLFVLTAHVGAADAAIIHAALRDFAVPELTDTDGTPIGDPRTLAQRHADALVAACRFAVTHRESVTDNRRLLPHVSLTIDIDALRASALRGAGIRTRTELDRCAIDHAWSAVEHAWFADALEQRISGSAVTHEGTELDATAVALLTCDSVLQRVMTSGNRILQLGRETRTASLPQRRAIIARDHHCRAPGCRTQPAHCDVHHVDHWINGGRTDVDRMVLLCGTHHRLFHRPGYRMELDEDATLTIHAPTGWTRSTTPPRSRSEHLHPPLRR